MSVCVYVFVNLGSIGLVGTPVELLDQLLVVYSEVTVRGRQQAAGMPEHRPTPWAEPQVRLDYLMAY